MSAGSWLQRISRLYIRAFAFSLRWICFDLSSGVLSMDVVHVILVQYIMFHFTRPSLGRIFELSQCFFCLAYFSQQSNDGEVQSSNMYTTQFHILEMAETAAGA